MTTRVLAPEQWQRERDRHRARVGPWVTPHLERRRRGIPHPVEDFLFTYYSFSPTALLRWHPGYGFQLAGGEEYAGLTGYADIGVGIGVTVDHVRSRAKLVAGIHRLLVATSRRPPNLGCFGLHEWAMVYRQPSDQVRHAAWPLRLGSAGTDAVVEAHRISCSHFDAYRFFTAAARPRNTLRPGSDDRPAFEQPGCLHAGMDLYKHAYRLVPMVGSDLVADCFELARDIRALDMRASPYDLTELGHEPLPIETPTGKRAYADAQRRFADRGAVLRDRLVMACADLLSDDRSAG